MPEKYDQNISQPRLNSEIDNESFAKKCKENHDENMKCLISKELSASNYLDQYLDEIQKLGKELVDMNLPEQIIKERIILRIIELSSLYYDHILDSCTPIEQFVISDMAPDMIVNSKNQGVIVKLIHRGIFVTEGSSIRFMNESFREYVIRRFTPDEKVRLKEKLGDTATTWQGYKLFLVLVMIGLFAFLFIVNRAFPDNLNKLFIVLGGGTVLITNLTGLLTRKETGNNK